MSGVRGIAVVWTLFTDSFSKTDADPGSLRWEGTSSLKLSSSLH